MFRFKRWQFNNYLQNQNWNIKKFSSSNNPNNTNSSNNLPTSYSNGIKIMHFIQGVGICGIALTGYIASGIDPKKATEAEKKYKSNLMHYHKSFGIIMFGCIFPRLYFRFANTLPAHVSASSLEVLGGKLMHYALYGMLVIMPVTGVGMGYTSGYGAPFFSWKMPGVSKEKAATESYKQRY